MLLLALAALLAAQSDAKPPLFEAGHWSVTSQPDTMTDAEEVRAALSTEGGQLVILCSRGERTVMMVEPEVFLGGPISRYELRDTMVRFDQRPSRTNSWKYVNRYATPYSQREMVRLLREMQESSTFSIRLLRYDNVAIDLTFDVAGTAEVVAMLAQRYGC